MTDTSSSEVSVLLGDGAGGFAAPTAFPAGSFPEALAAGLVDDDLVPDLVTANASTDGVTLLSGAGDGSLGPASTFGIEGHVPLAVATGRFDADATTDVALASIGTEDVSLLPGHGDGSFGPESRFAAAGIPDGLLAVDLNLDSRTDLVIPDREGAELHVLLSDGTGSFVTTPPPVVGVGRLSVAAPDLDGDGNPDLVSAARGSSALHVLLGNGDGTLRAARAFSVGERPASVATGDFDGNGARDLAVVNQGPAGSMTPSDVSVRLGNGDGTFGPEARYGVGVAPVQVVVADFDGDENPDLAVANAGSGAGTGEVSILLGNGDGTFAPESRVPIGADTYGVAAADMDGDARPDLAVAAVSMGIVVLLGNGNGTFGAPEPVDSSVWLPMAIGDVTGDGIPDLVCESGRAWEGAGDGTFIFLDQSTGARSVAVADFDNDGRSDVGGASSNGVYLWPNDGNQGFGPAVSFGAGLDPIDGVVADFNVDGNADIAALLPGNEFGIFVGPGDGSFSPPSLFGTGGVVHEPASRFALRPPGLAVDDFDGDGRRDLAIVNEGSATVTIALNRGPVGCIDRDGDGFGAPGPSCPGGPQYDCDDGDPSVYPGAPELLDALDNDCDLTIDEGFCFDGDGDGYGAPGSGSCPGGGLTDCDDESPLNYPGAPEIADGLDNNCDGNVDEEPLLPGPSFIYNVTHDPATGTVVYWVPAQAATLYELYRGTLPVAGGGGFVYDHEPLACGVPFLSFRDTEPVPAGEGRYYLIRGVNAAGKGYLGFDSNLQPRPDVVACP